MKTLQKYVGKTLEDGKWGEEMMPREQSDKRQHSLQLDSG